MTPLVSAQVRFIRANLRLGWPQTKIADMLGVSPSYVSRLKCEYIQRAPLRTEVLLDRWLNVHDIRAMGERAAEETG